MKRVVNKVSGYLHESMREPDGWGTISLPSGYDVTFDFECGCGCQLELRKDIENHPGCCSVIKTATFPVLKKGNWIELKDFEQELSKLFKDIKFSNEEIVSYLK